MLDFDIFKGFLILTELGKFAKFASSFWNMQKTELCIKVEVYNCIAMLVSLL